MTLNGSSIKDLPQDAGMFAIFNKSDLYEDAINCLTVKRTGNIYADVTTFFLSHKNLSNLLNVGISMFVIYETLDFTEFENINEKEEEWKLIYKPENINLPTLSSNYVLNTEKK